MGRQSNCGIQRQDSLQQLCQNTLTLCNLSHSHQIASKSSHPLGIKQSKSVLLIGRHWICTYLLPFMQPILYLLQIFNPSSLSFIGKPVNCPINKYILTHFQSVLFQSPLKIWQRAKEQHEFSMKQEILGSGCIVLTNPVFINTLPVFQGSNEISQCDYWSQQILLFYIIKTWGMVFQTHSIGCMIHWSPIIPPSWLFLCFFFIKSLSTMILLSGENCASRTLIRYERKIWCEIYEFELKSGGSG